jgi:hypothetical protein
MKIDIMSAARRDAKWRASVKWMDKHIIAAHYAPDPKTGLMMSKDRLKCFTAGNKIGAYNGPNIYHEGDPFDEA